MSFGRNLFPRLCLLLSNELRLLFLEMLQNLLDDPGLWFANLICTIIIGVQGVVGEVVFGPLDLVVFDFLFISLEKLLHYLLIQMSQNDLELRFLQILLQFQLAREVDHLRLNEGVDVLEKERSDDVGEDFA